MAKKEKIISIVFYVLLAVLAAPVFIGIFLFGKSIPFTDMLRPRLSVPFPVVFILALGLCVPITIGIYRYGQVPMEKKEDNILTGIFSAFSVPLFLLSCYIGKAVAFPVSWDVMVVSGAARKAAFGEALGYEFYYSIYPNNVPIVFLLSRILRLADNSGKFKNPEVIWIYTGCALMTLAVLFTALTVKRVLKNTIASVVTFLAGSLLIAFSGWKIAPYTDSYGVLFPILCLYFYVRSKQSEKKLHRIEFLIACVLAGGLGGLIKPNLYIVLIAIILTETVNVILIKTKALPALIIVTVLTAATLFANSKTRSDMEIWLGLEMADNLAASTVDYFYMGLNETTTGSYNADDKTIYGEFQDAPKSVRAKEVWKRSLERLKDKGAWGTVSFAFRKMAMTFSDGAFGWYNEVWVESEYDPPWVEQNRMTGLFRSIYRFDHPRHLWFATLLELVWFVVMLGVLVTPAILFDKRRFKTERDETEEFCLHMAMVFLFLGVFAYQLLFEARARYLFAFLPVIICLGMSGFHSVSRFLRPSRKVKKMQM